MRPHGQPRGSAPRDPSRSQAPAWRKHQRMITADHRRGFELTAALCIHAVWTDRLMRCVSDTGPFSQNALLQSSERRATIASPLLEPLCWKSDVGTADPVATINHPWEPRPRTLPGQLIPTALQGWREKTGPARSTRQQPRDPAFHRRERKRFRCSPALRMLEDEHAWWLIG